MRRTRRLSRKGLSWSPEALNQLVVDALGGSRPEERGRTALRLEREVGVLVGHGVYRSGTLLYS